MSQFDANNPYSANAAPQVAPQFPPTALQKMPGALNIVAIFFLILGGLGLAALPMAIIGMVIQSVVPQPQGNDLPPDVMFQQKLNEVNSSLMIPNMVIVSLNAILSIGFIFAGIQILKRKLGGANLAATLCMIAIPFELARGAFGGYSVFRQMAAMESMPEGMDENQQQIMQIIMTSAIGVGVCWVVGFTLFKIVFYAFSWSTVRKPANRAFLSN